MKIFAHTTFLARMMVPVVMFVLLLSLALNAFFLMTRSTSTQDGVASSSDTLSSSTSSLGPVAFGDVKRPVPIRPQLADGSGAMSTVKEYLAAASVLPALPKNLPLYRDQGVPFDGAPMRAFFTSLRAPVDPLMMQLLPDSYSFRSPDGLLKMSLSALSRTLTVTRVLTPSTPPPVKADDNEVMALAKTFAVSLNIDLSSLGTPSIAETPATSTQPKKTFVVWPMSIASYPVVGPDASIVPALTIQVGRVSHRAINAVISLLSPDVLAVSEYPVSSTAQMTHMLQSGGLLPFPKDQNGGSITYSEATIVYLLMPQDDQYPTYLLPAIKASFVYAGKTFSTLVPVLDEKHFNWQ